MCSERARSDGNVDNFAVAGLSYVQERYLLLGIYEIDFKVVSLLALNNFDAATKFIEHENGEIHGCIVRNFVRK